MAEIRMATSTSLMNPVIQALKVLGGSGTIEEIDNKASEIAGLSDEQLEVLHKPEKGGRTEVEYRIAWSRTYLRRYGVLENSSRGVWTLTAKGRELDRVNPKTVQRFVQEQLKKERIVSAADDLDEAGAEITWRDELMETLLKMESSAFERLIQRLLRESNFIQVEVKLPAHRAGHLEDPDQNSSNCWADFSWSW